MLKKTITYKDFDNNERTETHFFNLTKTELAEIALDLPDGIVDESTEVSEQAAMAIVEKLGGDGVFKFIKKLLLKSYGIKSPDGRRFEKSEEISKEFSETLAFDTIFMELMSDDQAAANFVNQLIPSELINSININNGQAQVSGPTNN